VTTFILEAKDRTLPKGSLGNIADTDCPQTDGYRDIPADECQPAFKKAEEK